MGIKKEVERRALKCMCVVWRTGKIWPKQIADCARVENLTSMSVMLQGCATEGLIPGPIMKS